ncbi:MAG: hypothetical protein LBL45_08365 [Treponema sp.]|jgi:hypothetical protein|nr:hypothetical protein [Treponema sp.]
MSEGELFTYSGFCWKEHVKYIPSQYIEKFKVIFNGFYVKGRGDEVMEKIVETITETREICGSSLAFAV